MKHAYRILDPATGLPTETPSYSGVPSAEAISEIAGPVGVVAAVATGSNPDPVGVLDMLEWKWRSIAAQHRNDARERTEDDHHVRLQVAAETLEACALELRLLTGATNERQPEPNGQAQTRAEDRL